MKTTLRIAKNELRALFYSPIAWFLVVVFLVDYGFFYTAAVGGVKTQQELGGPFLKFVRHVTANILGSNGLFGQVIIRGFAYMPLLTMGLMSRETSSGTIKLLYSSPIKVRQIIFGKYIAMMAFSLLMTAILGMFVTFGLFNIIHADAGPLFAGLFGIYLLLCAFSAIGLFMSCLTTYQMVAALSTLVMLAILSLVGNLWQDIDFVRDLTYFLSMAGRATHMMNGLLTTKDAFYFILISAMFLALSIYKLKSGRETRPVWQRWGRSAGIVLSTILLGYVLSRPGMIGYWDVTADKSMTLSSEGQEIMAKMKEGPLDVTTYINLLDQTYQIGRPQTRNKDLDRYELYQRFKTDMNFKYVYYYDSSSNDYLFKEGLTLRELAEKHAKTYKTSIDRFETPEEIRRQIDLKPENNRYVTLLNYGGKSTFLRIFSDQQIYPSEKEVLAAMKRLVTTAPRIAFVAGELERNITQSGDRQYKELTSEKLFRFSLINQGFDVFTVSLKDQEIPLDIAALVLADPKAQLDSTVMRKLEKYIAAGGNIMITGEPGRQDILNPLLKPLGVQLMDGMLVQQSKDFSPDLVQGRLSTAGKNLSKDLQRAADDSLVVSLSGAVGLSFDNKGAFDIQPLLVTDGKSSWSKKRRFNPDMIDKIEAPFAGDGAPMTLSSAGRVDPAKIRASARMGGVPMVAGGGVGKSAGKKASTAVRPSLASAGGGGTSLSSVGKAAPSGGDSSGRVARTAGVTSVTPGGADQNTTTPRRPQVVMINLSGGKSLREIVDSIRAANKGKTTTVATSATAVARSSTRSVATTGTSASTAATGDAPTMTLVPAGSTAGSIARADSTTGGRSIPATMGAMRSNKTVRSLSAESPGPAVSAQDEKPVDLAFSAADGDIRGNLPVALRLTRTINNKEQRIVVVGDADFLSNSELNRSNLSNCNFQFATSLFGWFSYGKFPIDVVRPEPKDNRVRVSDAGLTAMKFLFMGVLPALVAALGAVLLIRRRRK